MQFEKSAKCSLGAICAGNVWANSVGDTEPLADSQLAMLQSWLVVPFFLFCLSGFYFSEDELKYVWQDTALQKAVFFF